MKTHNAQGFTLFEILMVLAITSIMGGMLYTSIMQSRRVADAIERITSIQIRAIIAHRQLIRDLSGTCIPLHVLEPPEEKKESELPEEKNQKKSAPQQQAQKKELSPEEQKKLLAEAFNGTIGDKGQLKELLFYTNNPLEVFWSSTSGRPKPRSEKVIYLLEKEREGENPSYLLKRITTYKKSEKDGAVTQSHELISGIRRMKVTYTVIAEQKETNEQSTPAPVGQPQTSEKKQEEKSLESQIFNEWTVQSMEDDDIRIQKKVPQYITIELSLWAPDYKRSEAFTFMIPIVWQPIIHATKKEEPKKETPPDKKDEKKPEQDASKQSTQGKAPASTTPEATTSKGAQQ